MREQQPVMQRNNQGVRLSIPRLRNVLLFSAEVECQLKWPYLWIASSIQPGILRLTRFVHTEWRN